MKAANGRWKESGAAKNRERFVKRSFEENKSANKKVWFVSGRTNAVRLRRQLLIAGVATAGSIISNARINYSRSKK
jgi:hypothetical protein